MLRTAASRRVVGGVIEFVFHEGALRQRSRLLIKIEPAIYRNTARTLAQSDVPSRSPSAFEGAGCVALTGSDAGKLSIRPASSFAWVLRSAAAASRGLAACLSCAAGSNFSAMFCLRRKANASALRTFPTTGAEHHQGCPNRSGRAREFGAAVPGNGHRTDFFCKMSNMAQTKRHDMGSTASSMRLHPYRACDAPKTKFRSQPVWNFAFGAPGRPDRQAGGLCEKVFNAGRPDASRERSPRSFRPG